MIIACTNVIEQIDTALIRRFSIKKEITNPSSEEKEQFILLCMEKCRLEKKPIKKELLEKYLEEEKKAYSLIGKFFSSKTFLAVIPTNPVEPTRANLYFFIKTPSKIN